MPDARGDVLCPTCGQWTPPAPFCTECGAALQGDVRDAVGGQGSDVFRRGREVDQPGTPWSAPGERFEPEPEDEAARAAAAARSPGGPPVDHFTEPEPEPERAPEPPAPAPPWPAEPGVPPRQAPPDRGPAADERRSMDTPPAPAAAGAGGAAAGAAAAGAAASGAPPAGPGAEATAPTMAGAGRQRDPNVTPEPLPVQRPAPAPPPPPVAPPPASPPPPPRTYAASDSNGGVSGLVFVVILGVMVLALLVGATIGGLFDGGPTAEGSPSPTAVTQSEQPTPEASSSQPTPLPSAAPTATPSSSTPSTFPDGFIARAETCDKEPSGPTCDNSGSVNDGEPWILVSFRHAKPTDVIGITVADDAGAVQGEASLSLAFCEANTDCPGYTYDQFGPLDPGDYTVRVTRNGTLATTTSFTVE